MRPAVTRYISEQEPMVHPDAARQVVDAAELAGLHEYAVSAIREMLRLAAVEQELRRREPARLARIEQAAARVINTDEMIWWWLRRRLRMLNAVPLDLVAESEEGARRVEQILGQIEYGVYT